MLNVNYLNVPHVTSLHRPGILAPSCSWWLDHWVWSWWFLSSGWPSAVMELRSALAAATTIATNTATTRGHFIITSMRCNDLHTLSDNLKNMQTWCENVVNCMVLVDRVVVVARSRLEWCCWGQQNNGERAWLDTSGRQRCTALQSL